MSRPRINLLNWKGAGYHAFPLPRSGGEAPDIQIWTDFERILEKAKRGDFTAVPELVDLYDTTESWTLSAAYISLLGDAGTSAALAQVLPFFQAQVEPTYQVYLSKALAFWGKLSVVPQILAGWQELEGFQDAEDIPPALSMMLEDVSGPIADAPDHAQKVEYGALVLARYEELKKTFGTDDVFVFRGGRFSAGRVAGLILTDISASRFEPYMRRRFEATTGIDCSAFYRDGGLQPLAASSIVEEFLKSPHANNYEDGIRYFFGHRIPD